MDKLLSFNSNTLKKRLFQLATVVVVMTFVHMYNPIAAIFTPYFSGFMDALMGFFNADSSVGLGGSAWDLLIGFFMVALAVHWLFRMFSRWLGSSSRRMNRATVTVFFVVLFWPVFMTWPVMVASLDFSHVMGAAVMAMAFYWVAQFVVSAISRSITIDGKPLRVSERDIYTVAVMLFFLLVFWPLVMLLSPIVMSVLTLGNLVGAFVVSFVFYWFSKQWFN